MNALAEAEMMAAFGALSADRGVRLPRTRHGEWFCLSSHTSRLEVAMLEVVILRVLFLQAINRRDP